MGRTLRHEQVEVGLLAGLRRRLTSIGHEQRELKKARRRADVELLRATIPPLRLAWRSAELTAGGHRLELAREVRGLVHAADPQYLPSSSPVNRGAVRTEAEALLALAERLSELERPVAPRGVLMVERFLIDGSGPLYLREDAAALGRALARVATALEGRS
jgi:hypothetical protein